MRLSDLLAAIDVATDHDAQINGLCLDSRQVSEGDLFFAYPGASTDGRDFIEMAQAAGAAAIVFEAGDFVLPADITITAVPVEILAQKMGLLADRFYGNPSADLQVFGVTGTNGKTTCCYLLTQALTALDLNAGMIGTIGVGPLDHLVAGSHTTHDAITTHRLLAEMRDQGITQVCMEVSSHALDQGRVNGVQFFCTLFTNLSHDHLDYHGDMAHYAAAKQKLFAEFHSELVITNADDELGAALIDVADADFIASYSEQGKPADVRLVESALNADGLQLQLALNDLELSLATPLIGAVNIPNLLLLVTALLALSTDRDQIQKIVANLRAAPGRMELHTAANKPQVVIDYAHTPDALEKALASIRHHCAGELWCVFGCGGDRDADKRPLMGAAAERLADHLVVTNDNPRSEAPHLIAEQICAGIKGAAMVELDRAAAIKLAIESASQNDWVLVAGKGHEATQTIGNQVLPFSDRAQVMAQLGVAA
ncbi:MAG: UDP-N-acetylmuramoyl-L-alanyl-D-glutamate--2,6-diaminopimelate ligase [Gammaproteobacteria bacterium]|nr:UDP-N-acetylmuramoyl-L-alanyl-D-glutamate--2,6-diaminopimelate ligase [Gammaproteobacteria bacterium]